MSAALQNSAIDARPAGPESSYGDLAEAAGSEPWSHFVRLALAFLGSGAAKLWSGPARCLPPSEHDRRVGLFLLHQAIEFILCAIIGHGGGGRGHGRRKNKHGNPRRGVVLPHDLAALAAHALRYRPELVAHLPASPEEERLFSLVAAGYLKARYSRSFVVSPEEAAAALAWVDRFIRAGAAICSSPPARPVEVRPPPRDEAQSHNRGHLDHGCLATIAAGAPL